MFVVLGCVTVTVGLCVILFLPDTPMKARWLSASDKVALLKHVSVNQTGIQTNKFRPAEILDALTDPQLYLMVVSVALVSPDFQVLFPLAFILLTQRNSSRSPVAWSQPTPVH